MPFKKIRDYLPEFYHRLLPEVFDTEIPAESFSDCENCPMTCAFREDLGKDLSRPFGPDTKCCTFTPYIPNYLAGALLADNDTALSEGKKRLRETIRSRKGVFPHGIYPTKKYAVLYDLGKMHGFGKSTALKCPYFTAGKYNCSVWKYREAVCSTWFCKHIAQNEGREFWEQVTATFRHIEESLVLFVLHQETMTVTNPYGDDKNISFEDLDDLPPDSAAYSELWGKWMGKEEEFYIAAARRIQALSRPQFEQIAGIKFPVMLDALKASCSAMKDIPEFLAPDPTRIFTEVTPGKYRIEIDTWIERSDTTVTHAFDLPKVILDSFDGSVPTGNVILGLKNKHAIELGKDIIIALVRHKILMAVK